MLTGLSDRDRPAPRPADPPAVRRLRRVSLAVVAVALLAAGGAKLAQKDPPLSMLNRYLPSPRALRAGACLEIALALWLLSGRSPKLAPAVAAGTLAGLGLLVASELRRDLPLPSGTSPVRVTPAGTPAVRRELKTALGRDAFLAVLCGVVIGLTPRTDGL